MGNSKVAAREAAKVSLEYVYDHTLCQHMSYKSENITVALDAQSLLPKINLKITFVKGLTHADLVQRKFKNKKPNVRVLIEYEYLIGNGNEIPRLQIMQRMYGFVLPGEKPMKLWQNQVRDALYRANPYDQPGIILSEKATIEPVENELLRASVHGEALLYIEDRTVLERLLDPSNQIYRPVVEPDQPKPTQNTAPALIFNFIEE